MQAMTVAPFIPETAPFSTEQRAWLNGFMAGLFSTAGTAPKAQPTAATPAVQTEPVTILFGTQTGTAEALAKQIATEAKKRGLRPTVKDMADYALESLTGEKHLLVLTSTHGDGEIPDNAQPFWEYLSSVEAPRLEQIRFSVLALGDSNYPEFCAAGKAFDRRLAELGATCLHPRIDCDVDYEASFQRWLEGVLESLSGESSELVSGDGHVRSIESLHLANGDGAVVRAHDVEVAVAPVASSARPKEAGMPARLVVNRRLNRKGSGKDTRHVEFSLEETDLTYEVGDALSVTPANCPELVEELLGTLYRTGEEEVHGVRGEQTSLRDALLHHYEINRAPRPLIEYLAERSPDLELRELLTDTRREELAQYLEGRDVLDVLAGHGGESLPPAELVSLLRKLQPRLYSISSSPKACPGQVHLTVGVVRYSSHGRARKGVCSTHVADRAALGGALRVSVKPNRAFRLPESGDTPIIMVGPGTGIAPFRAFLQERRAIGARGGAWLFFGDQRRATDFLYEEELDAMHRDGTLTRFDAAFSRDQAAKCYVQHRMLEHAADLFKWLEDGAYFYVCGDASRMAKDVDAALHQIVKQGGGLTVDRTAGYVQQMRRDRRYLRDVY
jgi:sulfite reductase (NADPH) flavoprotein alpha-component